MSLSYLCFTRAYTLLASSKPTGTATLKSVMFICTIPKHGIQAHWWHSGEVLWHCLTHGEYRQSDNKFVDCIGAITLIHTYCINPSVTELIKGSLLTMRYLGQHLCLHLWSQGLMGINLYSAICPAFGTQDMANFHFHQVPSLFQEICQTGKHYGQNNGFYSMYILVQKKNGCPCLIL